MDTVPPESAELDRREESHLSQPLTPSWTGIIYWSRHGLCGSSSTYDHMCLAWSGERRGMEGGAARGRQNGSQAKECFILSPTRKAQSQAGIFFFFFFYKQGPDCSPGAPQAKNRPVSSGSCTTMIKIHFIHLSLVLTDWWLLMWKCAAWIMFSFNCCVLLQDPEEEPFPPLTHSQEIYSRGLHLNSCQRRK